MGLKRSKWCYSVAAAGRDLCYAFVVLFFVSYIQYTNLVNTTQFLALTAIIVLCRVWDAINDPLMGTIISNTKTRFGKFRPWILLGGILNSIILVLMFTLRVETGDNIEVLGWWNVGVLGFLYLLWGMTYTMNDVSYWSLLPVLSKDKKERDNLTSTVVVFASLGAFIAGGVVPIVTPGNMIQGYRTIVLIFSCVFLLSQIMVFFFTRDNKADKIRLSPQEMSLETTEESTTLKGMFKILLRNNQLLVMAFIVLAYSTASTFLTTFGQNFFYFKFGYDGNKAFLFTVVYAVGTLISQSLYPILASKFTRMEMVKVSTIVAVIGYTIFLVFANVPIASFYAFLAVCFGGLLVFAGQGVFYMVMMIMMTNTIEYDQWKTGQRNEAIIFSVRPFMVKLSGAVQSLIFSLVLVACGLYAITNQVGQIESHISTGTVIKTEGVQQINTLLQQATGNQMLGLTASMTLIPMALMVICYIVLKKKYIISEELYAKMIQDIQERTTTGKTTQ